MKSQWKLLLYYGKEMVHFRQDNRIKITRLTAHVQFWGNDELMEEFRFKNVLKELIGKTLQLSLAPNLAMSRLTLRFTGNCRKKSLRVLTFIAK